MINIVGSLRIEVPGTKVWSEQECLENPALCNRHSMFVNVKRTDKRTKKTFVNSEKIEYTTSKQKNVIKVIPLTDVAVAYMTEIQPSSCKLSRTQWKALPAKEKLMWHFKEIAYDSGGTVYDFNILT